MTILMKNILRTALVTGLILFIPFIAMQFTDEVQWNTFHFLLIGSILFAFGFTYTIFAQKAATTAYKAGIGFGLLGAFLLLWVNGAVGIIGSEDNPANLLYGGVFLVGFVGALIARFRARGMMYTLFAAALVQALVPVIALIINRPDFSPGIIGVFIFNSLFVIVFLVSALLFRRAV